MALDEAWIDLILKRGPELRRAGVLSIAIDGCSAVFAPAEPGSDAKDDAPAPSVASEEPANHWEHPGSYPTGNVPTIELDTELPPIPKFGDD